MPNKDEDDPKERAAENNDAEEIAEVDAPVQELKSKLSMLQKAGIAAGLVLIISGVFFMVTGGETPSQEASQETATVTSDENINAPVGIVDEAQELIALPKEHSAAVRDVLYPFYELRQSEESPDYGDSLGQYFYSFGDFEEDDMEWPEYLGDHTFSVMLANATSDRREVSFGEGSPYNEAVYHAFIVYIYDADGEFVAQENVYAQELLDSDTGAEPKFEITSVGYFYDAPEIIRINDGTRAVVIASEPEADTETAVKVVTRSPVGSCGRYSGANHQCLIVTNDDAQVFGDWEVKHEFGGHFSEDNGDIFRAADNSDVLVFSSAFGDGGYGFVGYEGLNLQTGETSSVFTSSTGPLEVQFDQDGNQLGPYEGLPSEVGSVCSAYEGGSGRHEEMTKGEDSLTVAVCGESYSQASDAGRQQSAFVIFEDAVLAQSSAVDPDESVDTKSLENAQSSNQNEILFAVFGQDYRFSIDEAELVEL